VVRRGVETLIDLATDLPNFAFGTREGFDVTHLDHGGSKIGVEGLGVVGVRLDEGVGGSAIEELLVRVKKALVAEQVLEVGVVEGGGRLEVERSQVLVPRPNGAGALALPSLAKGAVDVAVVVYARSEAYAPCLTYGVRPCNARPCMTHEQPSN